VLFNLKASIAIVLGLGLGYLQPLGILNWTKISEQKAHSIEDCCCKICKKCSCFISVSSLSTQVEQQSRPSVSREIINPPAMNPFGNEEKPIAIKATQENPEQKKYSGVKIDEEISEDRENAK
jgi:hypothetical protein